MRILLLLTRANLGGVAKYVAQLGHSLIADGHEVLVVLGQVQGSEIEDSVISGLPIHRIPSMGREISPLSDIQSLASFREIVKKFEPDIIHSHMAKAGFISRITSPTWYRKNGNPIKVHTFHGHSFSEPEFRGIKRQIFLALERILARRTHALISVGEETKNELVALGIGSSDAFTNIPPGVEFPILISQESARRQLSLDPNSHVVAWIGRMTSVKNPQAVFDIAKELPNTTFVMAGGGELLDGMKSTAPGNVRVIGWADSNIVLSASDVVLLTSHHEGMPLALIEAQLAGKPVVATNVGSVSEVIIDKETGFVGTPPQLTQFLQILHSSPEKCEEMGAKARIRATELFTIERMADKHRALYSALTKTAQS